MPSCFACAHGYFSERRIVLRACRLRTLISHHCPSVSLWTRFVQLDTSLFIVLVHVLYIYGLTRSIRYQIALLRIEIVEIGRADADPVTSGNLEL